MIRSLPIYKAPPPTPLDSAPSFEADANCSMCAHSGGKGATCLPHQGEVGGLLIVDSFPSTSEARGKRHLSSPIGNKLRLMVERSGQPVAYTSALRCAPKSGANAESAALLVPGLTECLPYLKHTIEQVKPTRIIALGAPAIYSLTGSTVIPSTTRGGFSWLKLAHGWVPVFYGISPAAAAKNKFLEAWLLEDFPAMLTQEPLTPPPEVGETWAKLVVAEASARQCLEEIKTSRWTAVDCEWAGRPYDKDFKLLSLAMTPAPAASPTLANDHADHCLNAWVWTQEALQNPACVALLKEWLRDPKQKKVGSYFKSDTVALHAALGIWTRGVAFDTRLLRKLMDAEASGKLADMAHLVGRGGHKDELAEAKDKAVREYLSARTKGKGGLFQLKPPSLATQSHCDKLAAGGEKDCYGFAFVDPELLYRYNAADTVVTSLVGGLLERRLAHEPEGMRQVAKLTVIPAGDTYARVESWGLRVDRESLETLGQYLDVQIREVEDRMAQYGFDRENPKGGKFQPGSPTSLGKFLFGELGLKSERTTDTGKPATDEEALEALADQHPIIKDILGWRKLSKMKGTYVEGLLGHIRDDGRVHPTIHPDGAKTGRTSSSNPNLQNQISTESADPVQAELAKMYKDAFAPPHGYSLLEVDYSQLELRMAADLSGDPAMIDIFKQGQDYHLRTAHMLSKTLWNITPEEVTDAHRREVKACIAEGSLVLTNNGLKEIQAVALDDLVWDGVEWVSHSGVVFQGVKEVIEYDGLIATPDHIVFTSDGRVLALGDAVETQSRLAVTAVAGQGLRYAPASGDAVPSKVPLVHRHNVCRVSEKTTNSCGQHAERQITQLSVHDATIGDSHRHSSDGRPASAVAVETLCSNRSEDQQSCVHCVSALRGAGNSEQVFKHSGFCGVLPRASASSDVSRITDRPDQQRWALRAGEPAAGQGDAESQEHLAQPFLRVQGAEGDLCRLVAPAQDGLSELRPIYLPNDDAGAKRHTCGEHSCQRAAKALGQKRVYDILNAGPRNRFTVSGKLVHNCNFALLFDDSPHGIAFRLGVEKEKAETLRDAIFGCFPLLGKWIKERVTETSRTGHAWTWWAGQPARRRPLTDVVNLDAPAGRTARRGSWNTPIQGTGNEYLVASAIQVVDWLVNDGIPAKLLVTIHDSMLLEVRNDCMSEVRDRVLDIMCSHQTKNGVPLAADAKCGPTWARMVKWKAGQPCPLEGCK